MKFVRDGGIKVTGIWVFRPKQWRRCSVGVGWSGSSLHAEALMMDNSVWDSISAAVLELQFDAPR